MSIPRIDDRLADDKVGKQVRFLDDLSTKGVKKGRAHHSTTKIISSRIGLHTLQAFSALEAEKSKIALKQGLISLPDEVINNTFLLGEEVENAANTDCDVEAVVDPSIQEQEEEISHEDLFLLADPELEGFIKRFQVLESSYTESMQLFKQVEEMQALALTAFEYGSANKDNIHTVASKLQPNQSDKIERSLDNSDTCFKEINCLTPFIMNGIKYGMILYIQSGLEKHKQQFKKMNDGAESLQSDVSSAKDIHQKCIDQLAKKLEQHKKDIEEEVDGKMKSLKTLAPRVSSLILRNWPTKTVDVIGKIAKHIVTIFMSAWKIDKIEQACTLQKAWLFRLQPRLSVNIYSDPEVADDPLPDEIETTQEKVVIEVNNFLSFLRNCTSIKEVQAKFEERGIPYEGPATIHEFQDLLTHSGCFSRHIVQNYYHYTGLSQMTMNNTDFKENLSKKEEEYYCKIEICLSNDINKHIDACQNKGLAYTKSYFKQHHIDIDSIELPDDEEILPLPPQTEAEWQECIQSVEFCRALAKQLVNYHEELAKSTDLATRQSLLSKHTVERKSIIFRGIGNAIEFLSSVIQIGLLFNEIGILSINQRFSQSTIFLSGSTALEMFLRDISKSGIPGIGIISICCPLYANMSLKLENIILLVAEHFVNVKDKPNEYSLDGYALALQMNALHFAIKFHALIFLCKQALLWLNIRLTENCIMHLNNTPFHEDPRLNQMSDSYQEQISKYKYYIEDLKIKLTALKIKDAELTMCPQLEKLRANLQNLEPLKDLTEKLDDTVDIDLFPSHVIDSIEDATGFRLTNANKFRFREHLEKLLVASETDFIKIYQKDHLAYMKA